jgi:hypothetical protein
MPVFESPSAAALTVGGAVPEAGGGRGAAGALGHVLVDLQVLVVVAVREALHRGEDHARVEFLDAGPGEAHAVERAGAEILDHDVGLLDQVLEDFLAFGGLGVQRQRTLVRVEHGEVERVRALDVAELRTGHVAGAGALDLDDVCAEPGKELRAGGTRLDVREVDNFDPFKRLCHDGSISLISR